MERVAYQGWVIDVDRDATRAAYASCPGWAASCGCQTCRNFVAARDQGLVYPLDLISLFEKLGIDSTRESEVHGQEPDPRDTPPLSVYHYAGWFNIIGRLIADEKDYSRWSDCFEIYPMAEATAASPAFDGARSCRLEFEVELPWVLPKNNTDQS